MIQPPNGASLNITSRTIEGIIPSSITLSSSTLGLVKNTSLTVSDDIVTVEYLYSIVLTSIDIVLDSSNDQHYQFIVTIDNTLDYHNETGNIITIAELSDGTFITVTDLITLEALTTAVSIQGSTIIANTNTTDKLFQATWNNPNSCNNLDTNCVKTNSVYSSITLPQPKLVIDITPNTTEITNNDVINNVFGIANTINVSVLLEYPGNERIDITAIVSNNLNLVPETDTNVITINSNTLGSETTTTLNFSYNTELVQLSETITINIISIDTDMSTVSFKPYPNYAASNDVTELRNIDNSGIYEQAVVNGTIVLTNGQSIGLSSMDTNQYEIESSNVDIISVNGVIVIGQSPGNAMIILRVMNIQIASALLIVDTMSVSIDSIQLPFSKLEGTVGSVVDLDVSLTLPGGQIISSLRNYSPSMYLSLIEFSSSNDSIVSITDNGQAMLLQNTQCPIILTATIKTDSNKPQDTTSVTVDLLPSNGGLDLAVDSTTTELNSVISVSVLLNTGEDNVVNGIENVLVYNSNVLQVLNVTVSESDWTGGPFMYSLANTGRIEFGGITLNEGLTGSRVHLADVYFMTASVEGLGELYAFVTNLVEITNNNSFNQLSIANDINASRIFIKVSDKQLCDSFAVPSFTDVDKTTSNCNGTMLTIGTDSYTCPIDLTTTTLLINELLRDGLSKDPNQDGLSNSLDPLYAIQVTFKLLLILESTPFVMNSSRDELSNDCTVTMSTELDLADGTDPIGDMTNVFILFNLSKTSFYEYFNTTTEPQYTSSDVVLLNTVYRPDSGEYVVNLQTTLEEIASEIISVSLIQVSNSDGVMSAAGIYPMVSKNGSQMLSNITLEDGTVLSINNYSPLYTINQPIVCPPLPSIEIQEDTIVPGNSTITFSSTIVINRITTNLYIYNCSRLDTNCGVSTPSYTLYDNWMVSDVTVTISELNPYRNYSFFFVRDFSNSSIFSVSTIAVLPEGFNEDNVDITRGPTHLFVSWTKPTNQNGEFDRTVISYTKSSNKRETETISETIDSDTIQEYNITNLTIATQYTVTVDYFNSVGSAGPVPIITNTTFPLPKVIVDNSTMPASCIDVTIIQEYNTLLVPISYTIILNCSQNNNDKSFTGQVTNEIMDTICYSNLTTEDDVYCSGEDYTVIVELTRGGFTTTSSQTVNINIIPIIVTPSTTMVSSSTISITTTISSIVSTLPSSMMAITTSSTETTSTTTDTTTSTSSTVTAPTTTDTTTTSTSETAPTTTDTTSSMTTTTTASSDSSSTVSTSSQGVGGTDSNSNGDTVTIAAAAVVVTMVIVTLMIVLLAMMAVWMVRRGKKRGSLDIYHNRPVSRTSKDIFFHMEETVEMSPIDIVPIGHNHHYDDHYIDETVMGSMGVIENKSAYHTGETDIPSKDGSMTSLRNMKPPPRGGHRVTFNEEKHAYYRQPPNDYYDDEDDELIDLRFHEDMISQPYLSLGLTPISQLSPDPLMSSSTGTSELGFFPSMPPPISPISSMMNTGGISVDIDDLPDHHTGLDNLVMPDGFISYNLAPVDQHKVKNKEQKMDSSGRLETLVEHSSLETDDLSSSFGGLGGRMLDLKANSTLNTSMSTSEDELIFPSADGESPLMTKKGKKSSSTNGMDFMSDFNDLFTSDYMNQNTKSISLSKIPSSNGNVRGTRNTTTSFMDFDDPIDLPNDKSRRQHAREIAKAEQKALLLERERDESLRTERERQEKIAQDYSTFSTGPVKKSPRGSVLQHIGKFEAVAELNEEKKSQELITSPTRSPRYGNSVISGLISPHHSYSGRPRKPSNDSLDPKTMDDQVTVL